MSALIPLTHERRSHVVHGAWLSYPGPPHLVTLTCVLELLTEATERLAEESLIGQMSHRFQAWALAAVEPTAIHQFEKQ